MTDEPKGDNGIVSLTMRVYVPSVDVDMVPALRALVLDVFDPFPTATVDVTMQAPRVQRGSAR